MVYRIRIHRLAQGELKAIFRHVAAEAGPVTADQYVSGIYAMIRDLANFPKRGTVRSGVVPDLRIIGYRRTASLAFVVKDEQVTILGVFRRGQNITPDMLKKRL